MTVLQFIAYSKYTVKAGAYRTKSSNVMVYFKLFCTSVTVWSVIMKSVWEIIWLRNMTHIKHIGVSLFTFWAFSSSFLSVKENTNDPHVLITFLWIHYEKRNWRGKSALQGATLFDFCVNFSNRKRRFTEVKSGHSRAILPWQIYSYKLQLSVNMHTFLKRPCVFACFSPFITIVNFTWMCELHWAESCQCTVRRLFSHLSAGGGKLLCADFKSEFKACTHRHLRLVRATAGIPSWWPSFYFYFSQNHWIAIQLQDQTHLKSLHWITLNNKVT